MNADVGKILHRRPLRVERLVARRLGGDRYNRITGHVVLVFIPAGEHIAGLRRHRQFIDSGPLEITIDHGLRIDPGRAVAVVVHDAVALVHLEREGRL